MKYRGLEYNWINHTYEWVYGMPAYGFETDEINEIGTPDGRFHEIIPGSLGEETGYSDRNGKDIYTGDITTLDVDGETREFLVERATLDREYNTLPGLEGETVKVRLAGVAAFRWINAEGSALQLLPCVDPEGTSDCSRMQIIDTAAERAVRHNEGESKEQ